MVKIKQFVFINYSFLCFIVVNSTYLNICSIHLPQTLLQALVTASGLFSFFYLPLSYRTQLSLVSSGKRNFLPGPAFLAAKHADPASALWVFRCRSWAPLSENRWVLYWHVSSGSLSYSRVFPVSAFCGLVPIPYSSQRCPPLKMLKIFFHARQNRV